MEKIDFTVLSSKGQIVIPTATRQHLTLKPGTRLVLYTDGANIVLRPILARDIAAFRKAAAAVGALLGKERRK